MTPTTQPPGERWTVHVCSEHGIVEPGELNRDLTTRCPVGPPLARGCTETLERVEVIPASHASALQDELDALREAVAVLRERADDLWNAEGGTNAIYRARSQGMTEAADRIEAALSTPTKESPDA